MRAVLLWVLLALAGCQERAQPAAQGSGKPGLALLTSLPIAFGESFTLDAPKSPLLARLEERFTVIPVDGPEPLEKGGLLLAIQPQALTAERLADLDRWVRDGGRLLLLADPELAFESSRPLGDRFRPPYRYPDTGLLKHWGVTLSTPGTDPTREFELALAPAYSVQSRTVSYFILHGGTCRGIEPGGNTGTVRCPIGKGAVILVADADFAMSEKRENQDAVLMLLDELRR